jgi:hypothetical protein
LCIASTGSPYLINFNVAIVPKACGAIFAAALFFYNVLSSKIPYASTMAVQALAPRNINITYCLVAYRTNEGTSLVAIPEINDKALLSNILLAATVA